jgi:hypothetical protein
MDKYSGDKKESLNVVAYVHDEIMSELISRCGADLSRKNLLKQASNFSVAAQLTRSHCRQGAPSSLVATTLLISSLVATGSGESTRIRQIRSCEPALECSRKSCPQP